MQTPTDLWCVELMVPTSAVLVFQSALEQVGKTVFAITKMNKNSNHTFCFLSALCYELPERATLATLFSVAAAATGVPDTDFTITRVKNRDWLAENLATFSPFVIGRFYIYGEHISKPPPFATVSLLVDATAVFGSGEHKSTQGCLLALDRLARKRRFYSSLDMGCGTGILGLAVAKLWHAHVCAVDIDPLAVRIAAFNARRNGVRRYIHTLHSNGFAAAAIHNKSFDLILSNILVRPLIRMAYNLARVLQPGGYAVLSGLLAHQEQTVLHTYRVQGLVLEHRIILSEWLTLILRKPLKNKSLHVS